MEVFLDVSLSVNNIMTTCVYSCKYERIGP